MFSGYYSNCFCFLKYSFLVVTVFISGCYSTHFWLLQYSFLVITVLVSAYFWLLHYPVLVVKVRVSACYGTCLCLLRYLFLVGAVNVVSGCYGSFLVVESHISGFSGTCLGWFLRITGTVSHSGC
jgi:hypothetical protein